MKALLIWLLVVWPHPPGFAARWVSLPSSISLQTYLAARKASARPSYCVWHDFGQCWTG
jgi:hypothetical protein